MTARRFHSHSLRVGRFSEPGRPYLVTTCTHERQPWFADLARGRAVVRTLARESPYVETVCFVLMPDHLHWLFIPRAAESVSSIMQRVKSVSARRLRLLIPRRHGRRIWQEGFHDHGLRREEHLRDVAAYVVMNPVRAGLVRRIGDYSLWDACWI